MSNELLPSAGSCARQKAIVVLKNGKQPVAVFVHETCLKAALEKYAESSGFIGWKLEQVVNEYWRLYVPYTSITDLNNWDQFDASFAGIADLD